MTTKWNRPIALLQIVGGVLGIIRTLYYIGETLPPSIVDQLIAGGMLVLYTVSIIAGLLLWQQQRQGVSLSILLQMVQIPYFSLTTLSYYIIAPLGVMLYVQVGGAGFIDPNIYYGLFYKSEWLITLWSPTEPFFIGLNLVPVVCLWYLRRQQAVGKTIVFPAK